MQDSEKKIYYDIVAKCWAAFSKERPQPEFSDEWWCELIGDYTKIRKEYFATPYRDIVEELSIKLIDQHERRQTEWKRQQKRAITSDKQQTS